MSITEDFATQWDFPQATKFVIPTQDRDFSRPKQPFFHSTVPMEDINMASDASDPKILTLQKYLKKSPYGISYLGPVDGIINDDFLNAMENLEEKISEKLKMQIPPIVFGDKIVFENFKKVLELTKNSNNFKINQSRVDFYNQKLQGVKPVAPSATSKSLPYSDSEKPKTRREILTDMLGSASKLSPQDAPDDQFNSPQQISLLEQLFQLPETGSISPELIQKLKNKESEIARLTNDFSVIGTIWNPSTKKILATANDIQITDRFVQQLLELKKSKS